MWCLYNYTIWNMLKRWVWSVNASGNATIIVFNSREQFKTKFWSMINGFISIFLILITWNRYVYIYINDHIHHIISRSSNYETILYDNHRVHRYTWYTEYLYLSGQSLHDHILYDVDETLNITPWCFSSTCKW